LPTPERQLFAIAVEGKPVSSFCRWLIVSSAIAQESSTAIAIRSWSADRGGRVAPPAADPSQATGRVKRRNNQLHRARVLEVRIQFPPAGSPLRTQFVQRRLLPMRLPPRLLGALLPTDLCDALARLIWVETAYNHLSWRPASNGIPAHFESGLAPDDAWLGLAPEVLYSACARAQIRNTRNEFGRALSANIRRDGRSKKELIPLCQDFVDKFTRVPSLETDFEPVLFIPLHDDYITLDFFLMQNFFDLCLHKMLTQAGKVGKEKGSLF
jgi:hypothetical protein